MPNLTIGYLEQEPKLDPDKTVRETIEEHRRSAPRMWMICAILLPLAFYCVAIRYYEVDYKDGSDVRVHDRLFGTWYPIRNEDCVIP